jgi:EAL domain-containing protein (putative c-di-GMP-specific phosphodiesterase class I)
MLKVDRAFVADIEPPATGSRRRGEGAGGAAIVSAVIGLARGLGLGVVAEGVEKQAQVDFLRGEGCSHCQGYLICPPLSAQEFERWLLDRRRQAAKKPAAKKPAAKAARPRATKSRGKAARR